MTSKQRTGVEQPLELEYGLDEPRRRRAIKICWLLAADCAGASVVAQLFVRLGGLDFLLGSV